MGSIFDDIKQAFQRSDKVHVQFIIVNVGVFIFINLMNMIAHFGVPFAALINKYLFFIPANAGEFIYRPWTLVTYAFAHQEIFHILFNMLWLYWFSALIIEYLGTRRFVNLYFLGAIAGGVIYLLSYNLIPYYIAKQPALGMLGASASVTAIVVGAATLLPNYTISLVFFGPIRIKYIAAFQVLMSFFNISGMNAGGNLAHLGGAIIGYFFIKQLQSGMDLGKPISIFIDSFADLFKKKEKIKVTHRDTSKKKTQSKSAHKSSSKPSQDEIDSILDKIAQSGYESLTKEEKQKLFQASND